MRNTFLGFCLVLVILTSHLVLAYGIGISSASETVCVVPGQVRTVTFFVSKSTDVTDGSLEVYISNVSWMYSKQYVEMPEGNELFPINITVYTPKDIEYGPRTGEILVCAPVETVNGTQIQPCVQSKLTADVRETCPEIEAQKEYFRNLIRNLLTATIFILLVIYLGRKVSKTKLKAKMRISRTKKAKNPKRRKK